ncbi:glutaredoxin family protein [Flavobacteriaceae bacterium GSB9]|nr:glutaredoxin family protein [Flavobacteriaceae bacterium GSB9]
MKSIIVSILFFSLAINLCFGQDHKVGLKNQPTKEELKKLIVYGSDTCHYCLDTKTYLKNNNLEFVYFDVDLDISKQNEMISKLKKAGIPLDAISLPIVDLGGKLVMNNIADFEGFLKQLNIKD